MVAARLRRVGNLGHLVDPGAVLAVLHRPDYVVLLLEGGLELQVWRPPYLTTSHRRRRVNDDDVANVRAALTDRKP